MAQLLGDLAYGNLVAVAEAVETGEALLHLSVGSLVSRYVPGELRDQVAGELNRLSDRMQVQHLGISCTLLPTRGWPSRTQIEVFS